MITIDFNTDTKILVNTLSGAIDISDVLNMYHQIEHQALYRQIWRLLSIRKKQDIVLQKKTFKR